jgi:hypothetical protein
MAITTRSSVAAVTVEVTENTPVVPTAAAEFIPIEDDFSMAPEFETLESAELRNNLGPSKPILGAEAPTANFSLYLKNSGVAGTAPNYGSSLLKALFGAEDDAGVEHDTVAGSTTSVVNVDVGEGATYVRGQALLVKKAGEYEIRPIESISSDALTMAFDLAGAAPGTGVDLGEAITYYPTNDGTPQTIDVWHYAGNGGAIQMLSGGRVVAWALTADAAQLINQSFTIEGVEFYFNPIEITASDIYLDFTDDGGTFAVSVTAQMYKDPHELAAAIQTSLNSVQTAETHACIYSDSTGKFTVSTSTSTVFSLLWNTGGNSANTIGDKIGFLVAADDTGSTSYISDNAQDWSNPVGSVDFDDADPLAAKSNRLMFGDSDDNLCVEASSFSVSIDTPKSNKSSICADSGVSGSVINSRAVTATVTALLNQHDADKFKRYRTNQETRLAYIFGEKSGGQWIPGKAGCFYMSTSTITSLIPIEDQEGLIGFTAEFTAYIDNTGANEVFLSFV